MAILSVDERYGSKDAAFFHAHRGPKNTVYPITPWVLTHHLAALGLSTPEQLVCRALLDYKYSLAMAKMDLGELAQEIGRSIRQVQRVIKKLREKELITVTPRPGRASIIDVSPLVVAVKRLLNWQEKEQPAPVETLVEVVAEPTEEELFWLQAADSEEDKEEEKDDQAAEIWEDIKHELHPYVDRMIRNNYLNHSEGVGWEGMTLLVEVRNHDHLEKTKHYETQARLLLLDRWNNVEGVKFQVRKQVKPKKLGPLARLAVAAVGV